MDNYQKGNSTTMSKTAKRGNLLPLIAAVVVISAVAVSLRPKNTENPPTLETQPSETAPSFSGKDITIQTGDIGTDATYINYDAGGLTVQLLAVQASDGTVRLALNTCQVCRGSPYAYFVQDGDWFIYQNCGNRFATTEIGIASGSFLFGAAYV